MRHAATERRLSCGRDSLTFLLLAAMPKCPMCVAVYVGFLAGFGISVARAASWATTGLLCAVGLILARGALRARQAGSWSPFLLGAAGLGAILAYRRLAAPAEIGLLGAGLLVAGSLVDYLRRRKSGV